MVPADSDSKSSFRRRRILISASASTLRAGVVALALTVFGEHAVAADQIAYMRPSGGPASGPLSAPAPSGTEESVAPAAKPYRVQFGAERVSREAQQIADWIVHSADNAGMSFLIVDKKDAKVFVFDAAGRIQGAAPALLGLARGDDTVPGIGDREFADMPPETRTTPAGRFVASLGMNAKGVDILWVDYDAAVSLHRVVTGKPKDRRLERLASPSALDNRISYGCINVPVKFFENLVRPAFAGTQGVVYVLPETRAADKVFGSYVVEERLARNSARGTETPN